MFEGQRQFLSPFFAVLIGFALVVAGCASSEGNSKPTLQFSDVGEALGSDVTTSDAPSTGADTATQPDATEQDTLSTTDQSSSVDAGSEDASDSDTQDQTTSTSACEAAGIPEGGACDGETLVQCTDGEPELVNCQLNEESCVIQDDGSAACVPKVCEPQCEGKTCGDDGCGGLCGTCGPGLECKNDQCAPEAGCQNCSQSEICVDDSCVPDPACEGYTWEGCCSGSTVLYCQNGVIKEQNCESGECGWSESGGYYNCNGGGAGPAEFPMECAPVCQPSCDGMSCGPDGCGGSCGACDSGENCQSGQCIPDPIVACPGIPPTGYCEGTVKITCEEGEVVSENCALSGQTCWLQLFPLPPGVACKPLSEATCPGFLEDGYCSGNVLITCEGTSLDITDCTAEENKICAFKAEKGEFGCINPN